MNLPLVKKEANLLPIARRLFDTSSFIFYRDDTQIAGSRSIGATGHLYSLRLLLKRCHRRYKMLVAVIRTHGIYKQVVRGPVGCIDGGPSRSIVIQRIHSCVMRKLSGGTQQQKQCSMSHPQIGRLSLEPLHKMNIHMNYLP
jgi:hypothetical protein